MKSLIHTAIMLFATALLSSCEGVRVMHGVVRDKNSKLPLDNVLCEAIIKREKVYKDSINRPRSAKPGVRERIYTSSLGKFSVEGEFGGCTFGCPDITVKFSKSGYDTLVVKNSADTVFYLSSRK